MDWDPSFKDYYDSYIGATIDSFGRWTLEKYGLYCPYSGLTTNVSEGFNNLFKSLVDYKEVDIDVAVLCFNQLQIYYWNEIRRGFNNKGIFSLKNKHQKLFVVFEDSELRECVPPENIAVYLNKIENTPQIIQQNNTNTINSDSNSNLETADSDSEQDLIDAVSINHIQNEREFKLHPKSSNEIRAQWFINNNRVELCAKMRVFNVKNEKDQVNVVSLNPDKCTCAEKKNCAHILAAKMSINFKVTKQSKKCNLTQLRLNSRNNKLTGRKYRDNIVDKPESSPLNTFTTDLLNDMDLIDTIEQREDNKATTSKDINSSEDLSDEKKRLFFSYVLIKKNKILKIESQMA